MRLIEKKTWYYLLYTFLVLLLASSFLFIFMRKVLIDGVDEGLRQESKQIISNIKDVTDLQELLQNRQVKELSDELLQEKNLVTVNIYNSASGEEISYRVAKNSFRFNNKLYLLEIKRSIEHIDIFISAILPVVLIFSLIMLAGILLINKYISDKLWNPFFQLVSKLKAYDLRKTGVLKHVHTDIDEFDYLSMSVERMTEKISKDFKLQKEFNENFSHELQTPLAIIRNKLEVLLQSQNLQEKDVNSISTIFDAVRKLSQLNKGLILLAEIDNSQYKEIESVDLSKIIRNSVEILQEQLFELNISIKVKVPPNSPVRSNYVLIEVLVLNLLTNAIRHNIKGGFLEILLENNELRIKNSGKALNIAPEELFSRFKTNSLAGGTTGLGLAIVKKICDYFSYPVSYKYKEEVHIVSVLFTS